MTGNKPEKGACGTKSRRTQNTLQKGCFSERLGRNDHRRLGMKKGGKGQGNSAVKRGTLQMRLRHFSLSVVDRQSIQTGILRI